MRFENSQKYAKVMAENTRKEIDSLEIELKHIGTYLKNYQTSPEYLDCKSKLDETYSKKADGVRIRSKCAWYKSGGKSNKFFLNLEKTRASQGLICIHLLKMNSLKMKYWTPVFL